LALPRSSTTPLALNLASRAAEKPQFPNGESWPTHESPLSDRIVLPPFTIETLVIVTGLAPALETKQSSFCASVLNKIALAMLPAQLGALIITDARTSTVEIVSR